MKLMRRMSASYPLIDSIYLVRFQDGKVFSSSKEWSLEQYLDREFIAKHRNLKSTDYPWTGARPFKEFDFQEPKRVISLVRRAPNSGGSGGMVVVNVAAASVTSMVKDWYGAELNSIRIMDGESTDLLFDDIANPTGKSFKVISNYMSPYTGWVYESGFRQDKGCCPPIGGSMCGLSGNGASARCGGLDRLCDSPALSADREAGEPRERDCRDPGFEAVGHGPLG